MRQDTIKNHIDNRIIRDMKSLGPDKLRQELLTTCHKFTDNITEFPVTMTEEAIEKIADVRSRYLSFYVYYAQQRIIDLYKVESRDIYGWDNLKKFKAFTFKDKLEKRITPF